MQPKNILGRWNEKYKKNFEIIERKDKNILAITRNKNEGLEVKKIWKSPKRI